MDEADPAMRYTTNSVNEKRTRPIFLGIALLMAFCHASSGAHNSDERTHVTSGPARQIRGLLVRFGDETIMKLSAGLMSEDKCHLFVETYDKDTEQRHLWHVSILRKRLIQDPDSWGECLERVPLGEVDNFSISLSSGIQSITWSHADGRLGRLEWNPHGEWVPCTTGPAANDRPVGQSHFHVDSSTWIWGCYDTGYRTITRPSPTTVHTYAPWAVSHLVLYACRPKAGKETDWASPVAVFEWAPHSDPAQAFQIFEESRRQVAVFVTIDSDLRLLYLAPGSLSHVRQVARWTLPTKLSAWLVIRDAADGLYHVFREGPEDPETGNTDVYWSPSDHPELSRKVFSSQERIRILTGCSRSGVSGYRGLVVGQDEQGKIVLRRLLGKAWISDETLGQLDEDVVGAVMIDSERTGYLVLATKRALWGANVDIP